MEKLRLGISACLLGGKTRYDGGDAKDPFISDTLGMYFDFIPVCPEAESGLPAPREPMRLEGSLRSPRLMTIQTRFDRTLMIKKWSMSRLASLKKEPVCGFIFKSRSPSCGLGGVDVFDADGNIIGTGSGVFVTEFTKSFPLVPVVDEDGIHDPERRANFIARVSAHSRLRRLLSQRPGAKRLALFHSGEMLLIAAHDPKGLTALKRLASDARSRGLEKTLDDYSTAYMKALFLKSTRRKNTAVLYRIAACLGKEIGRPEMAKIMKLIKKYAEGRAPLIAPIAVLKHYASLLGNGHLASQSYLNPHPFSGA